MSEHTDLSIGGDSVSSADPISAEPTSWACRDAALDYRDRDMCPIPLDFQSKKPSRHNWPNSEPTTDSIESDFREGSNVGIVLGVTSGGLADVDLDCEVARKLAPYFLPKTGMKFGRSGAPGSHYIYYCSDPTEPKCFKHPISKKTLLELRGPGQQTMFPPSVHPSGEPLEFEGGGEPAKVAAEKLFKAFNKLSAAVILTLHWPAMGSRHDAALALAGMLIRGGWTADEADKFVTVIAWAAGDDEFADRRADVQSTARRFRNHENVLGAPALAKNLPEEVVNQAAESLGIEWACRGDQPSHSVTRLSLSQIAPKPTPIRTMANLVETTRTSGVTSPLNLISLEDVKPEAIEWLWPGYIPKGKITDVVGDGDMGKSLVLTDIIARLSQGEPMPDNPSGPKRKPISIVMMVAEDDVADTVVPRLIAAGADLSRIKVLAGPNAGSETPITLPDHWPEVEAAIRDTNAELLSIDPTMAFLGSKVKSGIDSEVRVALMSPLKSLASRYDCAVLSLRHTNKSEGLSASMRGGGSVAFRNACRAGLAFGPDYDDEDGERRIMVQSKKNLGRQKPALAYRIESSFGLVETEGEEGTPIVVWEGVAEGATPDSVLGPRPQHGPGSRVGSKTDKAADWLRERLDGGISVAATGIQKEMEGKGFSKKVIEKAKIRAGVESKRSSQGSDGEGSWVWILK